MGLGSGAAEEFVSGYRRKVGFWEDRRSGVVIMRDPSQVYLQ